jgi:predicted Zn finger-like uncharacterized protein
MFTDCPSCQRQFRLTARHLSVAAGLVRCGFCGARFNALARLHDAPLNHPAVAGMAPEPELEEPDFDIAMGEPPPSVVTPGRPAPSWTLPVEIEDADVAVGPGRRWGWAITVLVLVLIGAGQIAWFQRDVLRARYPAVSPYLERLCRQLGCDTLRDRDLRAISVLNRDVRVHPRYQDALLVNATISNGARFAQPFPRIQLALSDSNGRVIAARAFAPGEYLDASIDQQHGMAPGAPVHVVLEIVGVGAEAVSFEIGFM